MVGLSGIFSQLSSKPILVVGDLLLDSYTIGKAKRISPEAPVPIVHVQKEEHRPGGAGNVVLNLVSLGSQVVVVGRIGFDWAGDLLRKFLLGEGVNVEGLFVQQGYSTPVKNRVLVDNQQIVRIDHEKVTPASEELEQRITALLPMLLEGIKAIAISDYGKGFLSKTLLSILIELAKKRGIPVIADPKGVDFTKYCGVTLLKPNLMEAYAAANLLPDFPLDQAAARILQISDADTLMVTRSEAGISLFHRNGSREDFPVRIKEVRDVTGAGDTVMAMVTCAMASQLSMSAAARLSNVAAGIAIEHFGCARVSLAELAKRLLEEDSVNKVFDEEHLFALQAILQGRKFAVVALSSREELNLASLRNMQRVKEQHETVLVYVYDLHPGQEFIHLLTSFQVVDFLLYKGDCVKNFCLNLAPEQCYLLKQGELSSIHSLVGLNL